MSLYASGKRGLAVALLGSLALVAVAGTSSNSLQWNPKGAAQYMDAREGWWQQWPKSQRDHGTVCVSCHSVVPYALSRPLLRRSLGQREPSPAEKFLLETVTKRIDLWDETLPYYKNSASSPTKTPESRGTESVVNALVMAGLDADAGALSATGEKAFRTAWTMQLKDGPNAGAWDWLNFGLAPWEAKESQYHGAAMAALAVGMAPGEYGKRAAIQPGLALLRSYLRMNYAAQPMVNQVVLLWASARLPGLLDKPQKTQLVQDVVAKQQADGGWSLASLGSWQRGDHTASETRSDGYATGVVVLALEENGVSAKRPEMRRGLGWLAGNQMATTGAWQGFSLNKNRDKATDVGRFMDDAATGYAVLALERSRIRLVAGDRPVTAPQPEALHAANLVPADGMQAAGPR